MNKTLLRIGAAAMSAALLAGSLCACASKKKTAKTIKADDPWYTTKKVLVGTQYDTNKYSYLYTQILGAVDGNFATVVQGITPMPSDFDPEKDSYADYQMMNIDIYDKAGEVISTIDLFQLAVDNGYDINSIGFSGARLVNDEIICDIVSYEGMQMINVDAVIDIATGEVKDIIETSNEDGTYEYSEDESEIIDGYTINKVWLSNDEMDSYRLDVVTPDGEKRSFDFSKEYPNMDITFIPAIISMGDGQALVYCQGAKKKDSKYMVFDLADNTMQEYTEDTDWLKNILMGYSVTNIDGMGSFILKQDGIKKLDFEKKELADYLDFDCCNINRADVMNMKIYSMTEDEVVLAGQVFHNYSMLSMTPETVVITLTKAETNPNAGKTVLTIASLDWFDYPICEAIGNFNENNKDYFIEYNTDYVITEQVDMEAMLYGDVSQDSAINDANKKLSDQLTVDLMSGEGPDIIINGSSFSQLNNSDYLLDLSPYTEKLDTSGMFTGVIDSSKDAEGKLYQIPLGFGVEGIVVNNDDVSSDQDGFTYEQYKEFVSGPCNGTDPMNLNQVDFFNKSASAMNEMFYENGKINCDCDAFRALAEYVKEYVPEEVDYDSMVVTYGMDYDMPEVYAQYATFYSISDYINASGIVPGDNRLLGCPTYDGRGPAFTGCTSAAIYSQTSSPDGCWAFIETLLSEDIQSLIAQNGYNPLIKDSLYTQCESEIEDANKMIDLYLSVGYTEAELNMYGISTQRAEEADIDAYIGIIENCTGFDRSDPAVASIFKEEMPAYFDGQKDLDEVIPIINDRVQTFLNERG